MISKSHKFIFIHVPKAAGNSVQSLLQEYSDDRIKNIIIDGEIVPQNYYVSNNELKTTKHSTLSHYYGAWKPEFGGIDDYTKFGNIRNPWDRAISYYFFRTQNEEFKKKEFLKTLRKPMSHFFSVDGKLDKVDYFIRFENLQEDFDVVCDKIGIPQKQLPLLNRTNHKHYTEYYDDEMTKVVHKRYKADIEFFGYKFGE